jgi:hypothetical protein
MKQNKEAERDLEASEKYTYLKELACDFLFETQYMERTKMYQEVRKRFDEWFAANPYHQLKHTTLLKGNPKEQVSYSEAEVRELLRLQRELCAEHWVNNRGNVKRLILSAPEPELKSSLNNQP